MKDEIGGKIAACDSFAEVKAVIDDYMDYYNNHRIKAKRKGLPPAIHRQQALSAA